MKHELLFFFLEFHTNGKLLWGHECNFLTLILEKSGASTDKYYRSISLISAPCKVLSKVLLTKTLHEAIDGNQFVFVKDRNIKDCILIVNESMEDYIGQKKKGTLLKIGS